VLYYFFHQSMVIKDRIEDLVLCRDERHVDMSKVGSNRTPPIYHLFQQDMMELSDNGFYKNKEGVTMSQEMSHLQSNKDHVQLCRHRLEYMTKLLKQESSSHLTFYRITGTDLDKEARKWIADVDLLNNAVRFNDEVRVHLWMLIITVLLLILVTWTQDTDFVVAIREFLRFNKFDYKFNHNHQKICQYN
jgi:hypothetical protein